jgi:hypothetical protein
LALADAITSAKPDFKPVFAQWRAEVEELIAAPSLESLAGEAKLETLSMALRAQWLGLAHSFADRPMKSPPHSQSIALPFSKPMENYIYERVIPPSRLEQTCQKRHSPVPGWESQFCLLGSAMGALTILLQVLPRFLKQKGSTPRWDSCVGYYETERLLRLHAGRGVYIRKYRETGELFERVASGKTDILLLEPSMYDWNQTVLDQQALIDTILQRPKDRPLALVLDTTLLGALFRMEELLTSLAGSCPLLAVELRSGLKLDQEGLELSNVGITRLFTREGPAGSGIFAVERWHRHMRSARKIFGNALSLDEMSILDLPWFCDPMRQDAYIVPIFANNARLATELSGIDGLFARIAHPCLTGQSGQAWAQSPFVILHFHDRQDRQANRDLLKAVIHQEVQRRGLTVHLGSSFGFRHHRFEIVIPEGYEREDGSSRSFLKVAMGHRVGPSCDGFIALLRELAALPDFEALKRRYPDVKPPRLPSNAL